MKKILALLMVLTMVFALAACGGTGETSSAADVDTSSAEQGADDGSIDLDDLDASSKEEETSSAQGKTLELQEEGIDYVVIAKKSKNITINSTDDFANYTVAYMYDCDSEVWANYYTFKNDTAETGMYMMTNDLQSGLSGNNFDIGIVPKSAVAEDDATWDIIWELKAE